MARRANNFFMDFAFRKSYVLDIIQHDGVPVFLKLATKVSDVCLRNYSGTHFQNNASESPRGGVNVKGTFIRRTLPRSRWVISVIPANLFVLGSARRAGFSPYGKSRPQQTRHMSSLAAHRCMNFSTSVMISSPTSPGLPFVKCCRKRSLP